MTTVNQQLSNIVDTAVTAGNFGTLVKAVQAAGLEETLKSGGPFTVFAPSDEAFRNLPIGTLEGLMKELPKLKSILTYHVIDRKIMSSEMHSMTLDGKMPTLITLEGSSVTLKTSGIIQKSVHVNDSKVTKPDIETSNGVIHAIDRVLMPPQ
jgi:uncharacterized surface protein with fasciclin (FAS1) repeats